VIKVGLGVTQAWNLWRRLALPNRIDAWSVTSFQQLLVNTGGRLAPALKERRTDIHR
jgi:hypothetical protein